MKTGNLQRAFGSDFGSAILATFKLIGFLVLVILLVPVQVVYTLRKKNDPFRLPRLFHRLLIGLLGLRVRVHGTAAESSPVLFVANHSSYLDIPILGSIIPGAFVAKTEVGTWPLFGLLAKLQRTVFVDRRKTRTDDNSDDVRSRLMKGQNLVLFPEGTSSDGLYVLPFKSALFSAVEEKLPEHSVAVQPVSITCTELDNLPITRALRPYYAWFGDMTLVGHLWNVFKLGNFTVDVVFHPPVTPEAFADRKALAAYCQQQVAHGIEQSLSGRHNPPAPPKPTPAPANDDAMADA
jgi:1-acyl-sn-glycerol-3-phosphate acyltransferase